MKEEADRGLATDDELPMALRPSTPQSPSAGSPTGVQLTYLPPASFLQPFATIAFPVMLPAAFQGLLDNGQPLSVVVAVLDDLGGAASAAGSPVGPSQAPDAHDSSSDGSEEQRPPSVPVRPSRAKARRSRRGRARARQELAQSPPQQQPSGVHWQRKALVPNFCTEEGSLQALAHLTRRPEDLDSFVTAAHKNLGQVLANAFATSVLVQLLRLIPYGRMAKRGSAHDLLLLELIQRLPRASMHPLGREVYLEVLRKASGENDLPSQMTKAFAEKLAEGLVVLVDCENSRVVLKKALQIDHFRVVLLASLQKNLEDLCDSASGCEFVSYVIKKLSAAQVAMTLLESHVCVMKLCKNQTWSSLLVQASSFGNLHQRELAERLRRASPDELLKTPLNVRRAALWT